MNTADINETLFDIFHDFFELDRDAFAPELTAEAVDGWDSLNHIRLMLTVQQRFGIRFSSGEINGLKNVGELAALVNAKT